MKIVDLKAMTIRMNGWHYPIVKIETDDGIHGLGEARDGADKRLLLDLKRPETGYPSAWILAVRTTWRLRGT